MICKSCLICFSYWAKSCHTVYDCWCLPRKIMLCESSYAFIWWNQAYLYTLWLLMFCSIPRILPVNRWWWRWNKWYLWLTSGYFKQSSTLFAFRINQFVLLLSVVADSSVFSDWAVSKTLWGYSILSVIAARLRFVSDEHSKQLQFWDRRIDVCWWGWLEFCEEFSGYYVKEENWKPCFNYGTSQWTPFLPSLLSVPEILTI